MWRCNNNLVWGMHGALLDSQLTSPTVGLNAGEEGEGENSITPTFSPSRWNAENKWQPGIHPLPHDKCDFQCHLIAQKCTAERSAFRKRQNDLGDISDSRGDAHSLSLLMYAVAQKERKIRKKRRWRQDEIKKWKKSCLLILLQIFPWPALTKMDDFY